MCRLPVYPLSFDRVPFGSISLFIFLMLASVAAPAASRSIPCATDGQGRPVRFNAENPYDCTITITVQDDGSEDVRIDQPFVNGPFFEYRSIVFSPSDSVTITADGCVQTAGEGKAWKKYVNPSGDQSGPTKAATDELPGSGVDRASYTLKVTSNEPDNGITPDVMATDWNIQLRAARAENGTGRIYTINASVKDQAGNVGKCTAICRVPLR